MVRFDTMPHFRKSFRNGAYMQNSLRDQMLSVALRP